MEQRARVSPPSERSCAGEGNGKKRTGRERGSTRSLPHFAEKRKTIIITRLRGIYCNMILASRGKMTAPITNIKLV